MRIVLVLWSCALVAATPPARAGVPGDGSAVPLRLLELHGIQAFESFAGQDQLALLDDLDGDGVPDIAIGADRYDRETPTGLVTDCGAVLLYSGATGERLLGADGAPVLLLGDESEDRFGGVVRWLPDLDDDGVGELVVSAPSNEFVVPFGPDSHAQYVRVYSGATLLGTPRFCRIRPPAAQNHTGNFGTALADAGRVDGDRWPELLIGSGKGYDVAYLYGGKALSRSLATGGDHNSAPLWKSEVSTEDVDGIAVSGFRDLDGDGYAEFVIGEYFFESDAATPDEGRIRVKRGAPAGNANLGADFVVVEGNVVDAALGQTVQLAGDLDGVPGSELLVGAPAGHHRFFSDVTAGRLALFAGALANGALVEIGSVGGELGELFGAGAAVGDLDGGGAPELLVAARYASTDTLEYVGAVRAWSIAAVGDGTLSFTPSFTVEGKAEGDKIGAMSEARDLNGDGRAEVLLGTGHLEYDLDGNGTPEIEVGGATLLGIGVPASSRDWGTAPVAGGSGTPPLLTLDRAPALGAAVTLTVSNTARATDGSPAAADAVLLVGDELSGDESATVLLLDPGVVPFAFVAGEAERSFRDDVADDPALEGACWCLQAFEIDPASPRRLSISRAIVLTFGRDALPW